MITVKSLALNDVINGDSASAPDVVYTAPADAQIVQITAHNGDTVGNSVYVYILPAGVVATSAAPVAVTYIGINESEAIADMIGHVVPSGGTITAYADVAGVVTMTVSGIEYTTDP
jgi:hypothetical protein